MYYFSAFSTNFYIVFIHNQLFSKNHPVPSGSGVAAGLAVPTPPPSSLPTFCLFGKWTDNERGREREGGGTIVRFTFTTVNLCVGDS